MADAETGTTIHPAIIYAAGKLASPSFERTLGGLFGVRLGLSAEEVKQAVEQGRWGDKPCSYADFHRHGRTACGALDTPEQEDGMVLEIEKYHNPNTELDGHDCIVYKIRTEDIPNFDRDLIDIFLQTWNRGIVMEPDFLEWQELMCEVACEIARRLGYRPRVINLPCGGYFHNVDSGQPPT